MDYEIHEIFPHHITFTNIGWCGPEVEEEFRQNLLEYLHQNAATKKLFSQVPLNEMKAAMLEAFKNGCSKFPLCSDDDVTGMIGNTIGAPTGGCGRPPETEKKLSEKSGIFQS